MSKHILPRKNGMPLISPYPVYWMNKYKSWGNITIAVQSETIDISEIPDDYLVEIAFVTRTDNGDLYSEGIRKIDQRIKINDLDVANTTSQINVVSELAYDYQTMICTTVKQKYLIKNLTVEINANVDGVGNSYSYIFIKAFKTQPIPLH